LAILFALHRHQFVGYGAGVHRQTVNMRHAPQPRNQRGLNVELEQTEHLRIPVLLDHVYPVMLLYEFVNFTSERKGAQAQVVSFNRSEERRVGKEWREGMWRR